MSGIACLFLCATTFAANLGVGGKDLTEQYVFAEMTTRLLQSKGYKVEQKDGMGASIVRAALESVQADLYLEYTGSLVVTFNKTTAKRTFDDTYAKVTEFDGKKCLISLASSDANNMSALAIRNGNPRTEDMQPVSDLASAYISEKSILTATMADQ
ncbi:glycine betaine ABC transporter substrate-binding protein [Paraburkholderia domus]|uniref:glycine betaine ABC transporter substrate-binding protein n=1 Tax=Paraburkholderia domus TaxID=2793075 RepID=UPI001BA4865E|nr:glycine betaine ABC transporter substrate-binding protein [Paraburkholderia domus]